GANGRPDRRRDVRVSRASSHPAHAGVARTPQMLAQLRRQVGIPGSAHRPVWASMAAPLEVRQMYSQVIEMADATLAANMRLHGDLEDLRAQTIALLLRYRGHRFPRLSGASDASTPTTPTRSPDLAATI